MFSDKVKKKYGFDGQVAQIQQLQKNVITGIFMEVIRPVLVRYNWSMDWAMGGVSFYNAKGEEIKNEASGWRGTLSGSKTLAALIKEVEDIFNDLPAFGKGGIDGYSLWWLMCGIQYAGRYSIEKGFQPCEDK